ncbi:MAG TPA: tRNA guanosine(34) transglycosylase Tgt [Candidatus Nanoarchaeia archaeon]|nr:tRNA guanosine(34) transglycosylase Tgt [Candidatus Nanoarchaeia archaeon]
MSNIKFEITFKDRNSRARTGIITTPHGKIETPVFMPVGTLATVKSITPKDLEEIGAQIILGNTYHLYLRPGADRIKQFGGMAKFMGWKGPTITDSGGFQAFSLGYGLEHGIGKIAKIFPDEEIEQKKPAAKTKLAVVDDDGVTFYSHIDNSKHRFTPELSIEIQKKLGADIILAFDECTSPLSSYEYTKQALARTHNWATQSFEVHSANKTKQALFGIIQGGEYKDLRVESAKFISGIDFDGYAIGGSLGKSKEDMHSIIEWTVPELDENKPRHLLGIGGVDDLFECIERGIDMFDCVGPTRMARSGMLLISPESGGNNENKWRLRIQNAEFSNDAKPIDKNCNCYTCQTFSRAYIKHLFVNSELLAYRLASYHNLFFMINLVSKIKESLPEETFHELKKKWLC